MPSKTGDMKAKYTRTLSKEIIENKYGKKERFFTSFRMTFFVALNEVKGLLMLWAKNIISYATRNCLPIQIILP